jgi:hypothetical protein
VAANAALAGFVALFDWVDRRVFVVAIGAIDDGLLGVDLVSFFPVVPREPGGLGSLQRLVAQGAITYAVIWGDDLRIGVATGA